MRHGAALIEVPNVRQRELRAAIRSDRSRTPDLPGWPGELYSTPV